MPRRLIDLRGTETPLLDVASYARPGPARRDRPSPAELDHIARTVRRDPEVMVKVLSRGGQDLRAICRHLDYLRLRDAGELGVETDDGQRLAGEGVAKELLEDWDLDLEEHRRRADLEAGRGRSAKLVHSTPTFLNHSQLRDWLADGEQGVWIQGVDLRWFYGRFLHPCHGLSASNSVQFDTRGSGHIDSGSAVIIPGSGRCTLGNFVPSHGPPKDRNANVEMQPQESLMSLNEEVERPAACASSATRTQYSEARPRGHCGMLPRYHLRTRSAALSNDTRACGGNTECGAFHPPLPPVCLAIAPAFTGASRRLITASIPCFSIWEPKSSR